MKEQVDKNLVLNKLAFRLIIGLSLQYILGITTTLFVEFPEHLAEEQLWSFAWKQIPLALHIILGIFLLIGSSVLFIRAKKIKSQKWIAVSSVGFILILATVISGSTFINTQSDIYSYLMAIGFIVIVLTYVWGIYSSKE